MEKKLLSFFKRFGTKKCKHAGLKSRDYTSRKPIFYRFPFMREEDAKAIVRDNQDLWKLEIHARIKEDSYTVDEAQYFSMDCRLLFSLLIISSDWFSQLPPRSTVDCSTVWHFFQPIFSLIILVIMSQNINCVGRSPFNCCLPACFTFSTQRPLMWLSDHQSLSPTLAGGGWRVLYVE